MSKTDKARKRQQRKAGRSKPSVPRMIGANDNQPAAVNDNDVAEPHVKDGPSARLFRWLVQRAKAEQASALPRGRAYDPSRLTPSQTLALKRAEEKLTSGIPGKVASGRDEILEIAQAVQDRIDAQAAEDRREEVRELEALRGSVIIEAGRNEPQGRLRIASRDGLETLMTAKALTRCQYAAGVKFRADYERIDPERGLAPLILDPAKVRIAHGGEHWDQKRREIENRVFGIYVRICGSDAVSEEGRGVLPRLPKGHPHMRAIFALVEIAGKGRNLSDLSSSGSVRSRLREDLIRGLDVCEIVYGLA